MDDNPYRPPLADCRLSPPTPGATPWVQWLCFGFFLLANWPALLVVLVLWGVLVGHSWRSFMTECWYAQEDAKYVWGGFSLCTYLLLIFFPDLLTACL